METATQMDNVLVRRVGSRMEDLLTGQLRVKRKLAELERTIGRAKSEIPDIAASTTVAVSLTVEAWTQFTGELREAVRPKFFRLKSYLLTLASILAVFGILAIFFLVDGAYEWLYSNTTGEPFTHIMRRVPIYYMGGLAVACVFGSLMPFRASVRLFIMALMFVAGFVGGHAFWGSEPILFAQ